MSRPFKCVECNASCVSYCEADCESCASDVCRICGTKPKPRASREKQLAATFFGFCVASDAYDAATLPEIDQYLYDHVRNPQDVDASEVLRIVNRLLEACK